MEVSGRRNEVGGDDHTTGILCDPCLGVNEEKDAVFYCTVCNEFLCDVDGKAHRKAGISKSHKLLDRNSMPRQKMGYYEDNTCPFHYGKILEYHCYSHKTSCCSVCASKKHKHCKIEYIDDVAKGYEKRSEYQYLMKDMTDLMRRLHSAKQYSLDNKSNAQCLHSEIVYEIRKFRVEINSILDSLENASMQEANEALHVAAAESTTTRCAALLAKLQQMTSSIEELRKYKQERQLVMQSKEARVQVQDIEDQLSKLSCLNKRGGYKFIPDKAIPQLLRSLKSLGRLEITEESAKQTATEQRAKRISSAEVLISVGYQPGTASHVRDIKIQHSTDTQTRCYITGGIMKGAGRSIVVPGQDALTASMLAAAAPQEQKQMLGERLFPLIQRMHPELAGKITGMLLEIDNSELLHMLESNESLKAKVEEADAVLMAHQAKEAAANQATINTKQKRHVYTRK